eukprot:Selendium_serpulae@DN11363_c0_g1_i1.p1
MKRYKPKIALMPDMVTGFSEGIMAVPQGMSYALLANMDPIYGLYCGLIYPMVYMFFGSSIHCSFGVSAIEAVLVADTINSTIGEHAPQDFRVEATLLLSVLMGLVFVAMRLAGLGVLADFLADPVLSGFSSASAIVIATKQFGYLFGIEEVTSSWMVVQMWQLVSNLGSTNWVALTMGCCGMGLLVAFRYINKRFKVFSRFPLPGALVLIVVTTLITWLARLDISHGLEIVGFIPEGLPKFTTPFSISYPHDTPAVTTASPVEVGRAGLLDLAHRLFRHGAAGRDGGGVRQCGVVDHLAAEEVSTTLRRDIRPTPRHHCVPVEEAVPHVLCVD